MNEDYDEDQIYTSCANIILSRQDKDDVQYGVIHDRLYIYIYLYIMLIIYICLHVLYRLLVYRSAEYSVLREPTISDYFVLYFYIHALSTDIEELKK